jgi:hypothetical protein
MRTVLGFFFASLVSFSAFSSELPTDPRNTAEYHVIFDLEAHGKTPLVNGYGAYIQIYDTPDIEWIRYCENFEGSGLGGRPNLKRERYKLVPFGVVDNSAYHCRDFSLDDIAGGEPLIALGNKKFFAVKSNGWSKIDGGQFLFQFAQKIPLLGAPTYKTLRIRAVRDTTTLGYTVETLIPRGENLSTHFFLYEVSGSGLGLPNGITGLVINPSERTESRVAIDGLEGPIEILGTGKHRN